MFAKEVRSRGFTYNSAISIMDYYSICQQCYWYKKPTHGRISLLLNENLGLDYWLWHDIPNRAFFLFWLDSHFNLPNGVALPSGWHVNQWPLKQYFVTDSKIAFCNLQILTQHLCIGTLAVFSYFQLLTYRRLENF